MAGRPQQILHGGTLKYLFGYFKIRIFYCSNRSSNGLQPTSDGLQPSSFLLLVVMVSNLLAMASNLVASCYW